MFIGSDVPRPMIFSSTAATRARSPVNSALGPLGNDMSPTWSPGLSSETNSAAAFATSRPPPVAIPSRSKTSRTRRPPTACAFELNAGRWSVAGCAVPLVPVGLCETNSADRQREVICGQPGDRRPFLVHHGGIDNDSLGAFAEDRLLIVGGRWGRL